MIRSEFFLIFKEKLEGQGEEGREWVSLVGSPLGGCHSLTPFLGPLIQMKANLLFTLK